MSDKSTANLIEALQIIAALSQTGLQISTALAGYAELLNRVHAENRSITDEELDAMKQEGENLMARLVELLS